MKCIILAGGKGTRISKEFPDIPKPMIKIGDKPVLQHQLETLSAKGIKDFTIIVGYLGQQISDYFGNGSRFNVNIDYYRESEPLGTAGALFNLNIKEDFLLCSGDLLFDFSPERLFAFHKEHSALATIFCHPSKHPFDSILIEHNEDGVIEKMFRAEKHVTSFSNCCSAGIYCISPLLLEKFREDNPNFVNKSLNLDKDVIEPLLSTNRIFAYKSSEYVCDMGTPDRKLKVEREYLESKTKRSNKNKAIFLDRDGTLNVHKGYITGQDDIELTQNAAKAINLFHEKGYLVILITNQPVIARGECTVGDLKKIHGRLEYLLAKDGAYLDDIFYCPHHPDSGFEGEVRELKIDCSCRKPKPGMILEAAEKHGIDLGKSYMAGDSEADVLCAKNAGCTPIFIDKAKASKEAFKDLLDFADTLK